MGYDTDYTAEQAARLATFRAAARGVNLYRVAVACNSLKWGVDYRGSQKSQIADDFARGRLAEFSGAQLRGALCSAAKAQR